MLVRSAFLFLKVLAALAITGFMPSLAQLASAQKPVEPVESGHKTVGDFSSGDLENWQTHGFNGETEYSFVKENGRQVLFAQCNDSASGLVLKETIDLNQTPILHWTWRVDDIYEGIDETKREGDDYPASVYVAIKTGITIMSIRAIHYVWSSNQPKNSSWDSAFTKNVKQVALRSGKSEKKGQWYSEVRNVKEDFKLYFDMDVEELDSVSLMTDCDNSDSQSRAYYGDIHFLPNTDSLITQQ